MSCSIFIYLFIAPKLSLTTLPSLSFQTYNILVISSSLLSSFAHGIAFDILGPILKNFAVKLSFVESVGSNRQPSFDQPYSF